MIQFDWDSFYSRSDLAEMLGPHGVDVDHFISRLRPRRVFRALYRGSDILEAWDRATELSEPATPPPTRHPGGRRGKTASNRRKKGLIGGVFSPEELGLEE